MFLELHRDRAAAAAQTAFEDGQHGQHVDTTVIEIALVLDGHDGLLHDFGDLGELRRPGTGNMRPSRLGPCDHDLGRSDEEAEGAGLQVPKGDRRRRLCTEGLRQDGEQERSQDGADHHRPFGNANQSAHGPCRA